MLQNINMFKSDNRYIKEKQQLAFQKYLIVYIFILLISGYYSIQNITFVLLSKGTNNYKFKISYQNESFNY